MTFIINYLFAFDLKSDHTITSIIFSCIFGIFILVTHGKLRAHLHESFRGEFTSTSGHLFVAVYVVSLRDGFIPVLGTMMKFHFGMENPCKLNTICEPGFSVVQQKMANVSNLGRIKTFRKPGQ